MSFLGRLLPKQSSEKFTFDEAKHTATRNITLKDGSTVRLVIIFAPGKSKDDMKKEVKRFDEETIQKITTVISTMNFGVQKIGKPGGNPYKFTGLTLHLTDGNTIKITKHYEGKKDKTIEDLQQHYETKEADADSSKLRKYQKKQKDVSDLNKIFQDTFSKPISK